MLVAAFAVALLVAWVAAVAVCCLKGKYWFAGLGVLLGPTTLPVFGAIRLAKPDSWWAARFYDVDKLALAEERFKEDPYTVDRSLAPTDPQDSSWDGIEINPDELDPITRRALKKAGRI
ncbi:MAG: hypothetical protein QOJ29_4285 [Thermoleophilaceae bacterium]|jgi:hypothetical protein|nr:hypothetical protein [Thermoleophilaceae bacterium]